MRKVTVAALAAVMVLSIAAGSGTARAAEAPASPDHEWSFEGLFGTYDRAALRRGLMVYRQVCQACHALEQIAFRHLGGVGYSPAEIEAIAAEYEVEDGPDDFGEMYLRTAVPSDYFPSPFPNDQAARAANGGALPPDLSVITKARPDGNNYLRALLVGFTEPPADTNLMPGMYYNEYFPGHQIAMAPPLFEDGVAYPDGTQASVEQMAEDVTMFLSWAAEPELEERKRLGIKVLLFLVVLTGLLYAVKRQIWADLH